MTDPAARAVGGGADSCAMKDPGADPASRLVRASLAGLPGVGLLVFDPDLCVVAAFGGALERLAYGPEDLAPLYARALAGETVVVELAALDGGSVYEATFAPALEDGAIVGGTLLARDVTADRAREDAIRRADAALKLFETTIDEAPIGMCLVGVDGRFLRVNAALCRLLERDEQTLLGSDFQSITHPDDLGPDLALMRATLAGERDGYAMDKLFLTPRGDVIHVGLSVSLVRHPDSSPAHFITQVVDLTERKLFEHQLRRLADHDALTGLYTRRRFADELRREVARTARHHRPGCLLMLDLDGFKEVNDSFGHRAGDELLRLLAAALRGELRGGDVLARIGGDEFAAILPDTDLPTGRLVANRLLESVRAHGRVADGSRETRVTASIGLTVLDADDRDATAETLLAQADEAMYRAKATGKDGVCALPVAELSSTGRSGC
jgi:diguanylate cyclase (GGDEF)-like protein/PAS domain S-box-containing protein